MGTRLYYRPGTASMAPHAALAEIGLDYELVLVETGADGHVPESYRRVNPAGLVPTLIDGDLVLTESAAILLHLAERHPEANLLPPPGTDERSEVYRWLIHLTNTVQTGFLRYFYPERYGTAGVSQTAAAELATLFDRIELRLTDREWIAGDTRTVADLFLVMLVRWGRRLDPPAWDRPAIRAHAERCYALPGVRRMWDEQQLDPPPFAA
jgi:glutathione S-transferase